MMSHTNNCHTNNGWAAQILMFPKLHNILQPTLSDCVIPGQQHVQWPVEENSVSGIDGEGFGQAKQHDQKRADARHEIFGPLWS